MSKSRADLEKDALKAADDYVAVVEASQHTSFQDGYFAGFAAGIEAAAKVADSRNIVGAAFIADVAKGIAAAIRAIMPADG